MVALTIALVVFASAPAHSSVTPCFHENTKVHLTGTVIYRTFHGPPNYGENPKTDRLMKVPLLRLDQAITPCELTELDSVGRKRGQRVRVLRMEGAVANLKTGEHRKFDGTIYSATMAIDLLPYVFDIR